jgi:purine-binding chemotaxis protein CheW
MENKRVVSRKKQANVADGKAASLRSKGKQVSPDQKAILALEEKKRILRERARQLAAEPVPENINGDNVEILEFTLAYENYGIEAAYVREVYPLTEITPVPCTPAFILGIINIRGQILSVIDLKKFFGLPEKGLTDLNKVIIIHNEQMEFGILADVVDGVSLISVNEIQQSLPTLTGISEQYLKGITGRRLIILDAEKILNDRKLLVHDDIKI